MDFYTFEFPIKIRARKVANFPQISKYTTQNPTDATDGRSKQGEAC